MLLNAFHNRRWDADIRTLKAVLDSGELGAVTHFESRFDLYEPQTVEPGPGGGVLSDLGSHLIDQALWLFGPATAVYAELDWLQTDQGPVDSGFFVSLTHQTSDLPPAGRQGRSRHRPGTARQRVRRQLPEQRHRRPGSRHLRRASRPASDDPAGWGYEAPRSVGHR